MPIDKMLTRKLFKMFDNKPKALRYAFGFTPKYEDCVLELGKTGSAAVLGKQMMKAGADGDAKLKICWGMMKVEGKTLTIQEIKKLTGIEVKLAKALKKAKLDGYTVKKGEVKGDEEAPEDGAKKKPAAAPAE